MSLCGLRDAGECCGSVPDQRQETPAGFEPPYQLGAGRVIMAPLWASVGLLAKGLKAHDGLHGS